MPAQAGLHEPRQALFRRVGQRQSSGSPKPWDYAPIALTKTARVPDQQLNAGQAKPALRLPR
jgi:hypothetical protein